MATVPSTASISRRPLAGRLRDHSWTQNTPQAAQPTYVFRKPLIRAMPPRKRLRDYSFTCNLVTTTLFAANGDPFIGLAAEAPKAPRRAREYSWALNLSQSTLAPSTGDPFLPPQMPTPRGALRAREYGWSGNLLQNTLTPSAVTATVPRAPIYTVMQKARRLREYGFRVNLLQTALGEPLVPVEFDPPPPPRRLRDYTWAPSLNALVFPTPTVTTPVVPEESSLGGTKARKKVRGPYSDPAIYEEYIKRCVAEREAPREDIQKAVLTEALVSEVEMRRQTQYAERDALLRENQILQRLLDMEKAKRDIIAIRARSRQIEAQLQKIEDDEIAMLLAAFDQFDED